MRKPSIGTPEAVVAASAALLLCGAVLGALQTRDDPGPAAAAGTLVEIRDFQFGPEELTATVGDAVTWTNLDDATHTVRGDATAPSMSDELDRGETYTFTFDAAGTYTYVCTIHPSMMGTVLVLEEA